jgi:hypothetical protein
MVPYDDPLLTRHYSTSRSDDHGIHCIFDILSSSTNRRAIGFNGRIYWPNVSGGVQRRARDLRARCVECECVSMGGPLRGVSAVSNTDVFTWRTSRRRKEFRGRRDQAR